LSKPKKEKIPDTKDEPWIPLNSLCDGIIGDVSGLTFSMDTGITAGTYQSPKTDHEVRIEALLNEIVKILIEIKNK